jgi:D-serine deaminase-like pyridoxal phosphate-dependent protein
MATSKMMLDEFPWREHYRLADTESIVTPALIVYPEIVAANIAATLRLLNGDPNRWRAHIKTAKLAYTLRMLIDRKVTAFKCATTLELLTACQCGARDVLLAYPVMGGNARRTREISQQFPEVSISVLVENEEQLLQWKGSKVGIFMDINPGMNRTGIEQTKAEIIIGLIQSAKAAGVDLRGLHYYDGQFGGLEEEARAPAAHAGYDRLLELVEAIARAGIGVSEVITAGSPTFPNSLSYAGFVQGTFLHRVSPGTIVYCDATSLSQLQKFSGYAPAALVLSRVVSQPNGNTITCDAGHKAVSADAGVPTCVVVGHPGVTPLSPSEEHLPIQFTANASTPRVGDLLYLLPRHVCPTVNNFDSALLVKDGRIESIESVTARGHDSPLLL